MEKLKDSEETREGSLQKLIEDAPWLINPEWAPVTTNQTDGGGLGRFQDDPISSGPKGSFKSNPLCKSCDVLSPDQCLRYSDQTTKFQGIFGRRIDFQHTFRRIVSTGLWRYSRLSFLRPDISDTDKALLIVLLA